MNEIKVQAKSITIVPTKELTPNPVNRNKHSKEQIEHLAAQYEYQGMRNPIVVSNQSGLIVAGHGRLLAAKKAGLKEVPVSFQDFVTPEQEYAYGVADNGTALWAELDLSGINADIQELGPDFDIDMLGLKNFKIDISEKANSSKELDIDSFDNFQHQCPKCGFEWDNEST